jgi:hypothetical protein
MITHSIVVNTEPIVVQTPPFTPVQKMGKMEYAHFLSRMDMKKGDVVYNKHIPVDKLTKETLFKVEEIQEIHYMCDYEQEYPAQVWNPKCILIKNVAGLSFWTIPSRWVLCSPDILDTFNL